MSVEDFRAKAYLANVNAGQVAGYMNNARQRAAEAKIHASLEAMRTHLEVVVNNATIVRGHSQIGATVNYWSDQLIRYEHIRQMIEDAQRDLP